MVRLFLVLAALLLLNGAQSVFANDSNNPFHGFNIGIQGGYSMGQRSGVNTFYMEGTTFERTSVVYNQSGGHMGVHMGYNHVLASGLFFGGQLRYSFSDVQGELIDSLRDEVDQYTSDARTRLESMVIAQGRIGYATESWSVYAVGGYTIVTARNDASFTRLLQYPTGPVRLYGAWSDVEPQSGWTVGAGAAYAIDDRVSLSVDYNFLEFDEDVNGLPGTVGSFSTGSVPIYMNAKIDTDMHLFTFGISYRL